MRTPGTRRKELHLERMFETRSEAWERVGLAVNVSQRAVRRAQREALVLVPCLAGVLVAYFYRKQLFGVGPRSPWETPLRIATVLALVALGWTFARDVGRAAAPTFFRRMDPGTAGTVGFLIRLATILITLLVRVGERIRLQTGSVGGSVEGIVSSLGLLYTTLARGEDRILIPNNVVIAAAVVPLREPESVDVKVRLASGIRPSHVQALLDDQIKTTTRSAPAVLLEEIDGDELVVRVQATPERSADGAQLADEIIEMLASVTGEHTITGQHSFTSEPS